MKKWGIPRILSAINSNFNGKDEDGLVFLAVNIRLELDGGILTTELVEGTIPDGSSEDDFEPVAFFVFGDIHDERAASCFFLLAPGGDLDTAAFEACAHGAIDALPDPGIGFDIAWIKSADKAGQWTYAAVVVSVDGDGNRIVHLARSPAIERDKAVASLKEQLAGLRAKGRNEPRQKGVN